MLSRMSKNTINLLTLASLCILFSGPANADAIEPVYTGEKPSLPYTPGVKLKNGMLFVSGQIAYVKEGIPDYATDGIDDMADQAKIVMENLEEILSSAGYNFNDAVKVSVFMTDIDNYDAFNKVYANYWQEGDFPPAREAIEISALPGSKAGAEVLVEVSLIAFK